MEIYLNSYDSNQSLKHGQLVYSPELRDFLNGISDAKEIPAFARGQLQDKLYEFACNGCGKDKDCNNDDCNKCYNCGCYYCRKESFDYCDYDNSDSPSDYYNNRIETLEKMLLHKINQSALSVDEWASILSKKYIKKYFPYKDYKEIWRKYILDETDRIEVSKDVFKTISDEDKPFFKEFMGYMTSYNVLRIMAGIGGLSYTSNSNI